MEETNNERTTMKERPNGDEDLPPSSSDSSDEDESYSPGAESNGRNEEELRALSDDLKVLDEQAEKASRMLIYKHNKYIFLLQSTLLGISYSIIWPTLLLYVTEDSGENIKSASFKRIIYGVTYVAYPLGSMLSAKLVERTNLSTKKMVLLLNCFEIVGNLIYTFSGLPLLPAFGRFVAGLGDAFYVVLMKEMSGNGGVPNEKMTIECLAAFVVGVILSPGINIVTTMFLQFKVGFWKLNERNFPGLTVAVLFVIMQFIILVFLRSYEDDGKKKKKKHLKTSQSIPKHQEAFNVSRFFESTSFIRELEYTSWFVNCYAFVYTYIVALLELLIPFIMYQRLNSTVVGVMLLYAIIGTVYAMFLMITMTVTFDYQPEVFVCISVMMQIAGLFAVTYYTWLTTFTIVADIVGMAGIILALTSMWSIDDVLFINFVQMFVPYYQRETTHNTRKFMSKLAFGIAGLTVPVLYPDGLTYVTPGLICVVCLLFTLFILIKYTISKKA